MINIYQIHLTDNDIIAINSRGWEASERGLAYSRMQFAGHEKWKPEYMPLFELTYSVDTNDLEEAFEITNLWNQDYKVTRHSRGHSTSVGDILVKDGNCYMVDRFGFTNIGKFEGF